jgi:hypothetical protein
MKYHRNLLLALLLFSGQMVLTSCGSSGDSNDSTLAKVLTLRIKNSSLSRGEKSLVDVDFSFAESTVFDDDRSVVIAVKLPQGVSYLRGSGKVDSNVSDDDVDPLPFPCAFDGGTLLVFDLDDQDLRNADSPSGEADGRLKLEIQAVQAGAGTGNVEAKAGYDLAIGSCDESLLADEFAPVTVLP